MLQVFILDSLATYQAADDKEAEKITERVAPRLQHANCAVVLSAVKVRSLCAACGVGKHPWRLCSSLRLLIRFTQAALILCGALDA